MNTSIAPDWDLEVIEHGDAKQQTQGPPSNMKVEDHPLFPDRLSD